MVDLILHAGMHKCGSTFIQNTLFENEPALKAAGILYPRTGLSMSNPSIGVRHVKLTHAIKTGRLDLCQQLHREIAESGARTVVISHEGMALPEHDPENFRQAFDGYDTTVVIYGRSPAEYIEALYRSSLRSGTVSSEIAPFMETRLKLLDITQILATWRTSFGDDRVRFFPFADFSRGFPLANHLLEAGGHPLPELPPTVETNTRDSNARTLVRLLGKQLNAKQGLPLESSDFDQMALDYESNEGRLLSDELLERLRGPLDAFQELLRVEGHVPAPDRLLSQPFDAQFFDEAVRDRVRQRLITAANAKPPRPARAVVKKPLVARLAAATNPRNLRSALRSFLNRRLKWVARTRLLLHRSPPRPVAIIMRYSLLRRPTEGYRGSWIMARSQSFDDYRAELFDAKRLAQRLLALQQVVLPSLAAQTMTLDPKWHRLR